MITNSINHVVASGATEGTSVNSFKRGAERSGLPKMLVVAEELDELIGFTSGRTNISKDLKQDLLKSDLLKQGLLKLRKSLALTK